MSDHILLNNRILFVLSVIFGSYVASKITRESTPKAESIWKQSCFRSCVYLRYVFAFIGGVLLMLGARIAQGCTSGHAINGGAQLSVVSWIFMMAVFITAIPTALIIFRKNRGK